eukprot:1178923-Prorocentrum_minimum.AAC.4
MKYTSTLYIFPPPQIDRTGERSFVSNTQYVISDSHETVHPFEAPISRAVGNRNSVVYHAWHEWNHASRARGCSDDAAATSASSTAAASVGLGDV